MMLKEEKKMKKIVTFLLICLCSVVLAACESENYEDLGEKYIEGMDYQTSFGSMPQVQKVGNAYYFLAKEHLYYYDESMKEAVPVCNKVDCDHLGTDCNASMSGADEINYYDHKFYYISSENNDGIEWYLYYLSEDGKRREKVAQIATLEPSDRGISFQLCVHRGYAYFSVLKASSLKKRDVKVDRISLDGNAEWENVQTITGFGAAIMDLSAYGNSLVVMSAYANTASGDFFEHTNFVDIRTGTEKKDVLYSEKSDLMFLSKVGNKVYYYDTDKVCVLDIETNKSQEIKSNEKLYADTWVNGEYIYSCNAEKCRDTGKFEDYGLNVFRLNGEKAGYIPMNQTMTWQYGDEKYIFAESFTDEKREVLLFDKKDITNKSAKWKSIIALKGEDDGD